MMSITNGNSTIKGNFRAPKQYNFIQSGTRPLESKIITSLRDGNTEYVARYEQAKAIQALANSSEQVIIMQVDGMYELKLKNRKGRK